MSETCPQPPKSDIILKAEEALRKGDIYSARKILEALMRNTHRVVLRQELEHLVWGDDPPQSDALKIHIHTLREIVDKPFPTALIKTVRGAGYRLYAALADE